MSPGGEYTGDITVADPEPGLILPGEEDIVVVFASSSDFWGRDSCVLYPEVLTS